MLLEFNKTLIHWFSFKRCKNILCLRDCMRNFKWPSMQRWQCPIHNGTLHNFKICVWSSMNLISMFIILKTDYVLCFFYNSDLDISTIGKHIGINRTKHLILTLDKLRYLPHYWLDKESKGTVVNRELGIVILAWR